MTGTIRDVASRVTTLALLCAISPTGTADAQRDGRSLSRASEGTIALRGEQERERRLLGEPPSGARDMLDSALQAARDRERQYQQEGDRVRYGIYRYPARLEALRWTRTREIIERIVPGPNEHATLIEMLAREAAAIEIILDKEDTDAPNLEVRAELEHVYIGTIRNPDYAKTLTRRIEDESLIVVSTGFIDYLWYVTEATLLSWRSIPPTPGSKYSFATRREDIESFLDTNQHPQELLYHILYAYLFEGKPPVNTYHPSDKEYGHPFQLLFTNEMRFVIAHEYGHAMFARLPAPPEAQEWTEELKADSIAFFLSLNTAFTFDQVAPNVVLQGGILSLAALDVLRKARETVRCGDVREDVGSKSHPPAARRIELLVERYRREVEQAARDEPRGATGRAAQADLRVEGARVPEITLEVLWQRIRPQFVTLHRQGRKLHGMWGESPCK